MAYVRHNTYPRYFYYTAQPASPAYASKRHPPTACDVRNIRLLPSSYYLNRINIDRRNRVMDQRSDYLFINRKPDCLCDIEREDFGTSVKNVQRQRHPEVNYECFNNEYFRFSVNDRRRTEAQSCPSIQSDPCRGCEAFEGDCCLDGLNSRHTLTDLGRRRMPSPFVIAEATEDMTRNPGSLATMSARSNLWPHNSQQPKKSLRAASRSSIEPLNTTYNNNNVNGNNNNNDCDDKKSFNNQWRGKIPAHLVVDDEKMARMRSSYRYIPPAPARYPHASTATGDRYEQLGLVLRGNLMLSSTYRENAITEFRRSYTQDVADRRVAETDQFNMQKDELSKWNELRVVYDNILKDYGKKLQEDKDKKQAANS